MYDQRGEINCENANILSTINFEMKGKKCGKRIHTEENDLKSIVFVTLLHMCWAD